MTVYLLFAEINQVFSKKDTTSKKKKKQYWKNGKTYWKSQEILSVRKSVNYGISNAKYRARLQ